MLYTYNYKFNILKICVKYALCTVPIAYKHNNKITYVGNSLLCWPAIVNSIRYKNTEL